jgi:hypothetical protein
MFTIKLSFVVLSHGTIIYERECNYRLAVAVMKTLLGRGLLTKDEYRKADKRLVEKYNPVWGQLPELAIG